jgi:diphosphomevalonate decarboxylase
MSDIKKNIYRGVDNDIYNMVEWTSPSNIALVKYWGKKKLQLPRNASVSLTLNKSLTRTRIYYKFHKKSELSWSFLFEGQEKTSFNNKIATFFRVISDQFPELTKLELKIESSNTFPHSSGIASSASSMSAIALCLLSIKEEITAKKYKKLEFLQIASEWARLGSGSASRSVIGNFSLWGKHHLVPGSSDKFAIPLSFKIHPELAPLKDAILIVSSEKKQVSSTMGHVMMETHPFAKERFKKANENLISLLETMKNGNKEKFISIVENEAMMLHGMMMSSDPGFFLILPNTLHIIDEIKTFREKTGAFIAFTLDAGPNVHVIYHQKNSSEIEEFIKRKLLVFCENEKVIIEEMGSGPEKII